MVSSAQQLSLPPLQETMALRVGATVSSFRFPVGNQNQKQHLPQRLREKQKEAEQKQMQGLSTRRRKNPRRLARDDTSINKIKCSFREDLVVIHRRACARCFGGHDLIT